MPTEIKIIDKNMRKDPSTGKMVKSDNYKYDTHTEKIKTTTRGGVVRKKVVGEYWEGVRRGKLVDTKNVKIDKFDKSGKLKKSVAISKDAKVVSRPGKEDVTKKLNFLDKRRLNKNI
jgi:hypothetical protein